MTPDTNENVSIEVPKKTYQVYNTVSKEHTGYEGSILISRYNSPNGKHWMEGTIPPEIMNDDVPIDRHIMSADSSVSQVSNFKTTK
jgi:hypothetical protein